MLPLLIPLAGAGAAFLAYKHGKKAAASTDSTFGKLTSEVKQKVQTAIATATSPTKLRALANGLVQEGAHGAAAAAHQKADVIERQQAPYVKAVADLTSQQVSQAQAAQVASLGGPVSYLVAGGDAPARIAARFSLTLAQFAKANGAKSARIMRGQIIKGEKLALPPGAVDKGLAKQAGGIAT